MRTAIAFGFHTDMPVHQHSATVVERCRKIWWTVYILDSHMSALMGAPRAINERDISAQLPTFGNSMHRSRALHIHIKLANIEGMIQQSKSLDYALKHEALTVWSRLQQGRQNRNQLFEQHQKRAESSGGHQ